jgi:cytoskeletal protein RodZ
MQRWRTHLYRAAICAVKMSILRRAPCYLVVVALLLITAHRLPAPISEESTPTPPPEQSAKPKTKPLPKPKLKSEASESATNPITQRRSSKQSRFAGSWVGTMPTIPWGNLESVVTIDATETNMAVSWYDAADAGNGKTHDHFKPSPTSARGHVAAKPAFAKAHLDGNTLTASFPAPLLGTSTWSITPETDGATARVRMQAFMNDFSAVFHRTAQ